MRIHILATAAATLLLASAAGADGPNTGRNWDDSHMRSRHVSAEPPKTRPGILVGDVASGEQLQARTLPEGTWHSWADGGQSVTFGRQPARQRSGSGLSVSNGRSTGRGSGTSLGSTSWGLR